MSSYNTEMTPEIVERILNSGILVDHKETTPTQKNTTEEYNDAIGILRKLPKSWQKKALKELKQMLK